MKRLTEKQQVNIAILVLAIAAIGIVIFLRWVLGINLN